MTDPAPLQFERAEHDAATPQAVVCAACGQTVHDQYYEVAARTVCEACRRRFEATAASGFDPDAVTVTSS